MFWVLARNNQKSGRPIAYWIIECDDDLTDHLDPWIWPWTTLGPYECSEQPRAAMKASTHLDETDLLLTSHRRGQRKGIIQ